MGDYLDYLQRISNETAGKRKRDYLAHNFSAYVQPGATVLEIGPGLGDFLEFAKERGASAIDIIDREHSIAEHLKKSFPIRHSWIFEVEDLRVHHEQLHSYDCIFMLQVMEHVRREHVVPTIETLYRHLSPGGVLIITVPNGGNPLSSVERYSDFTHELVFSENSLRQVAAFAVPDQAEVLIQGYRIPPSGPLNLVRIVFQKVLHALLTGILIVNAGVYFRTLEPNISLIIRKPRVDR